METESTLQLHCVLCHTCNILVVRKPPLVFSNFTNI
ncbi:Hypothetical protein GL50581_607 [Giardia duodenalis ATCC 50581]|uniref:Uncharacterized protein n=1 Tax=Giardia intestinalis (strain ATCC 50581 / GS clone H7) TaxID=598745 RepID=C6LPE2_GIAIB|nr:Hypothetical protein GL50581_607 [Giardia intestinalis ATCC 50581]